MDMEQLYSCVPHKSVTMFLSFVFFINVTCHIKSMFDIRLKTCKYLLSATLCYIGFIGVFGIFCCRWQIKIITVYPKLLSMIHDYYTIVAIT